MVVNESLSNLAVQGPAPSRIALVTGATGDIGLAITRQLAVAGFNVMLVSRNSRALNAATEIIQGAGVDVKVTSGVCDVRDATAVTGLLTSLVEAAVQLPVLVNCAGVSGGGVTAEVADDLWRDVIDTNLSGTFFVTKHALRLGLIPDGGRIINIASTGGKQGVIHGAPYAASKHGVVGFTKSLGLELARTGSGITVNAVCPGFVESAMAEKVREHYAKLWNTDVAEARRRVEERVPIGRYVEPDEVAAMVGYLASPAAAAVTAQALNVCGGLGNY